jgi:hypothetical protein
MTVCTNDWVLWRFRNEHDNLGDFGELLWSRIISSSGLYYVQLSTLPALNGKGPRLQGNDVILPDFEITGGTKRRRAYMDSKCKTRRVLFEKANELRHGFNATAIESYEWLGALNMQKCCLGVIELLEEDGATWSGRVLIQTLARLGPSIRGFSNQSHMVYWPCWKFVELATLTPASIWSVAQGDEPFHEQQRLREFFGEQDPPVQGRLF